MHWEPDDLHFSAKGSMALGQRLAPHVSSWLKQAAGKTPVSCEQAAGKTPASCEQAAGKTPASCEQAAGKIPASCVSKGQHGSLQAPMIMQETATSALSRSRSNSFSDKVSGVSIQATKVQPKVPLQRQMSCGYSMMNAQRKLPHNCRSTPFPSQRMQLCR
jgi:hypothetical protein